MRAHNPSSDHVMGPARSLAAKVRLRYPSYSPFGLQSFVQLSEYVQITSSF